MPALFASRFYLLTRPFYLRSLILISRYRVSRFFSKLVDGVFNKLSTTPYTILVYAKENKSIAYANFSAPNKHIILHPLLS